MQKRRNLIISPQNGSEKMLRFYILFALVSLFLTLEMAYFTNGNSMKNSLFWNGHYSDHFMDFFNTLRDSHDLSFVYVRGTIYPPLSILMMYLFSLFLPQELVHLKFAQRKTLQSSQAGMMLYFFFALLCLLCFAWVLEKYMREQRLGRSRFAVLSFIIISFPCIYCLERGNTSLLAMAFCAYFIFFRNSEKPVERELSFVLLALAAGLKLFPATLGILLLYDRRYKAAARTVLYGIASVAVPYLLLLLISRGAAPTAAGVIGVRGAYGGPPVLLTSAESDVSLSSLLQNLIKWTSKRGYFSYNSTSVSNFVYALRSKGLITAKTTETASLVLFLVSEIFMAAVGFLCRKEWQKAFIGVYLMLNIHTIAMHYTLVYLLPVFVMFLFSSKDRESPGILNWIYFALFQPMIVLFPYILTGIRGKVNDFLQSALNLPQVADFSKLLSGPCFQILAVVIAADIIISFVLRKRRNRHLVVTMDDKGEITSTVTKIKHSRGIIVDM